jgi:excisionase family DNA binding protein
MAEVSPAADDRLLSIEQAQVKLGVGRSTIFELIRSGQLGSVKVLRRRLIPESSCNQFIAALPRD